MTDRIASTPVLPAAPDRIAGGWALAVAGVVTMWSVTTVAEARQRAVALVHNVAFSDVFFAPIGAKPLPIAERRAGTLAPAVEWLWGAGWFVMPNPVYSVAAQGGMDAVFPPATRWALR